MMSKFEMIGLGILSYFFGMKFLKITKKLMLHQRNQRNYDSEILKMFKMNDYSSTLTPIKVNVKLEKGGKK